MNIEVIFGYYTNAFLTSEDPPKHTGGLLDDNSTRQGFQHSFHAHSKIGLVIYGSPKVHPLTPDFNLKGSTTFVRMSARRDRDLSTTRVDGLAYGSISSWWAIFGSIFQFLDLHYGQVSTHFYMHSNLLKQTSVLLLQHGETDALCSAELKVREVIRVQREPIPCYFWSEIAGAL